MPDDLNDWDARNRTSSTASSRRGACYQGGGLLQIHHPAGPGAEVPIQTVLGAVPCAVAAPQTEPADGWYDRPSSTRGDRCRTVVAENLADRILMAPILVTQNLLAPIAVGRVAMIRTLPDQSQSVPAGDGNLPLAAAPGAKDGQLQTVSLAEIPGAVRT
jgi:hypothetical protein